MLFDVTTVIASGCHTPRPYKTADFVARCCCDSSTDQPFPVSLPVLGPPIPGTQPC